MRNQAILHTAQEPDDVLVERSNRGDDRAFAALYTRHARYVAGVVYGIMGSNQDLEDLVQEVFILASRKLDSLREPDLFRPWLVQIAIRLARRRLSQRKRRLFIQQEAKKEADISYDPRERPVPADLAKATDGVSLGLLIPWFLQRVEEHSLDEVSAICGISVATVKRRVARAEKKMRRNVGYD